MKVDVHTHIWNSQFDRVDEFVGSLDQLEIDMACVLPIAPYMNNEDIARIAEKAPDRIIGWASVLPFANTTSIPRIDPVEDLRHAVENLGLKGVKLHPMIQGFNLADPGLVPVVQAAGELGVPILFHTGPSNGRAGRIANAKIELLDDLAVMCPDTVLIAGHANPLGDAGYLARKHPNVYLEPSIAWIRYCRLIPGLAADVVEHAGADKILFGTDFSLGKADRVTDMYKALSGIDASALDKIYAGNLLRILGKG